MLYTTAPGRASQAKVTLPRAGSCAPSCGVSRVRQAGVGEGVGVEVGEAVGVEVAVGVGCQWAAG